MQETRNKLVDEVQADVRNWQKEHHHKSTLPPQHLKEAKSLESDFDIAQKPWAKKLKKMSQCKKDYHQQCKALRSLEIQNKIAVSDGNTAPDQLKKLDEKVKKTEKDLEKAKSAYDSSIQELTSDCSRYTDEMTKVFNKSQAMERERMIFFKTIFSRIQKILNFSENKSLPIIYYDFEKVIESLDADIDVKQWSQSYGADAAFVCPQFEEYTQELSNITKKKPNNDTGVVLTSINTSSRQTSIRSGDAGSRSAVRTSTGTESSTPSPNLDVTTPVSLSAESPVFADESGTRVRALYDYNGAEEDELTLTQGEIFLKLEDEDEQGWCKGKKDGRVGLYPANYAESV